MGSDDSPTPEELADAPALAVLAVLDHALDVAQRALLAAHPDLAEYDPEISQLAPTAVTAAPVLEHAQILRGLIARYFLATALEHR